jgi:predicted nucleic acid-binding protein
MPIELIYWDSDCFLGWFQEESGKVELCQGTLARANAGDVLIVTSALTIAEVLWMRRAPLIPEAKANLVRRFFRRSYMRVRNVTRAISESAQDLVWSKGIKPKDAIHVATALDASVMALETFDHHLIGKNGLVGNPPLIIRRPIAPQQGELFGSKSTSP